MLGVVPGTLFLKLGSPWIIKALLGVFIIGLGIEMATRDRAKPHRPNALARTLISFASGSMAGLFGINLLFHPFIAGIQTACRFSPIWSALPKTVSSSAQMSVLCF